MKMSKFIITGLFLTGVASMYVHQHAEIYKTGYDLQRDREKLACLVDHNSDLMYTLSIMETPRYLLASLEGMDMRFAGNGRVRAGSYLMAGLYDPSGTRGETTAMGFFDVLTATAEADDRI